MKRLAAVILVCSVLSVSAYPISGNDVNCRSGPGTRYGVKRQYNKGHEVKLSCQTEGEKINGNSIWDKTTDGCYVSDYYVKTGVNGYVTSKCSPSSPGGGSPGGCSAPKSNKATVDLVAEFEGFRASVCKSRLLPPSPSPGLAWWCMELTTGTQDTDPTGNPTVGYGHLCQKSKCSEVKYSIPLSAADGKKLLADDMGKFEKCIAKMVKATLNLNQYGALVSWSFNMGCGAAEDSTLVKRLNKGENVNTVLSDELPKWVHGGGEVLPGLVRRRKAEIALAKKSGSGKALPAC
jgi:lysozyme